MRRVQQSKPAKCMRRKRRRAAEGANIVQKHLTVMLNLVDKLDRVYEAMYDEAEIDWSDSKDRCVSGMTQQQESTITHIEGGVGRLRQDIVLAQYVACKHR